MIESRDALLWAARERDIYWGRVQKLIRHPRSMTLRAAKIVVDAAMYGKGCLEGEVRKRIEEENAKVSEENREA